MTKQEIKLILKELYHILSEVYDDFTRKCIENRIKEYETDLEKAPEDIFKAVLKSHDVICKVKNMDAKAAYGQNPFMYYALAVSAESGEMANKIVRALRNGDNDDALKEAVRSELPDVIIYSSILAMVSDLNLTEEVNKKVDVVIKRAENGYYGGPLKDKKS